MELLGNASVNVKRGIILLPFLNPQRPEKNMGPGWRLRPRAFAPQTSVMAASVRDDVGHEYTGFMRGGEDARLHGRFIRRGQGHGPAIQSDRKSGRSPLLSARKRAVSPPSGRSHVRPACASV